MKVDKEKTIKNPPVRRKSRFKASFTLEAAIAVGFILCFLSMSISYEMQEVHLILEKIMEQGNEQEKWSMEVEIKNYIKFKEITEVFDQIIKTKDHLDKLNNVN